MRRSKGFASLIVLLVIIVFIAIGLVILSNSKYQPALITPENTNSKPAHEAPENTSPKPVKDSCITYGPLSIIQFLEDYTVKSGDTLFSIAKNELGDTSRASETALLNKRLKLYPDLSVSNPFIEVGWKLYLPPKYVKQTAGNLQAYAGEITRINTVGFEIAFEGGGGGRVNVSSDTQFLLKQRDDYEIGDCLFHIEDVRSEGNRILYILPLTEQAMSDFKALSLQNNSSD